jgi:hypothetical protein
MPCTSLGWLITGVPDSAMKCGTFRPSVWMVRPLAVS